MAASKPRRRVYLDELLDAHQVADLLGLSGPTVIGAYRSARKRDGSLKWPDFPQPVLPIAPASGKCYYWLKQDIERWRERHPPVERPQDGNAD